MRCREAREPSPWRDRPAEVSLRLFSDMRRGLLDEGSATLRCADLRVGRPSASLKKVCMRCQRFVVCVSGTCNDLARR